MTQRDSKSTPTPEVGMLQMARREALVGQAQLSKERGEKIVAESLAGGVVIWSAFDGEGKVPVVSIGGLPAELTFSAETGEISREKVGVIRFMHDELKIPIGVAVMEVWAAGELNEEWRNSMQAAYGVPEKDVDVPAVVAVAGMPEQYKSFLMAYLAANGEEVINWDDFSPDNLPAYQHQSGEAVTMQEIVESVSHEVNSNTRPGNEFWKVADDRGGTYWVKKQHYIWEGMAEEELPGVVEAKVGDGVVSLDIGVDIPRRGQVVSEEYSLHDRAIKEYRRVFGGGRRPEIVFLDTAGYWVRQGNIYDLVATESMTTLVPQRVQFQLNREWQVRDDEMHLPVLQDYVNFFERNRKEVVKIDRLRDKAEMSAVDGDASGVEGYKKMMAEARDNLKLNLGLKEREKYLQTYLDVLREWARRGGSWEGVNQRQTFMDIAFEDFKPNQWQLRMAEILGGSATGEVVGTTRWVPDLRLQYRRMLEEGTVLFPQPVDGGRYVMIDGQGVFLVEYSGDRPFEQLISPGRQSEKALIEFGERDESCSLREKKTWHVFADKVTITSVDSDSEARRLIELAQRKSIENPLMTTSDKYVYERVGQIGRVTPFTAEV